MDDHNVQEKKKKGNPSYSHLLIACGRVAAVYLDELVTEGHLVIFYPGVGDVVGKALESELGEKNKKVRERERDGVSLVCSCWLTFFKWWIIFII